jgi:hypothetical protein
MRTSFHHQSEAQSPNGPLTAATSPDTPSPSPTTQSCANPEFPVSAEHPRFSAVWGGCNGPFAVSAGNEDRPEADWGPSSLTSEIHFPVRDEGSASLEPRTPAAQDDLKPVGRLAMPCDGERVASIGLRAEADCRQN